MRPVTIVAPANYQYVAPANISGMPPNAIRGNANSNVSTVYNVGAAPTTYIFPNRILDSLLRHARGAAQIFPNAGAPAGTVTNARTNLIDNLTKRYRQAKADLTGQLDFYCSFCEAPIAANSLAIEHRLAKSHYPLGWIWWGNFTLACPSCNSSKSNNPSRAVAAGFPAPALAAPPQLPPQINPVGPAMPPPSPQPAPASAPDAALMQRVIERYFWPDMTNLAYRWVERKLWRVGFAAAYPVGQSKHLNNQVVNAFAASTTANIRNPAVVGGWDLGVNVEVRLNGRPSTTPGAVGAARTTLRVRTLALTGLSTAGTARVALRTQAWLWMIRKIRQLRTAVNAAATPAAKLATFNLMWPNIQASADAKGFYTTHVEVLRSYLTAGFPNIVFNNANFGAEFVQDADNNGYFIGTNIANVP